ncbi:hypothetical protein H5J25_02075 [Sphingomonas aliaeris]|uniref:DUF3035 domain-containing protein n=1 Tax=Sphingomonas aliaeris TaxID=2759526 RepID=A0A974NV97_9SPHN|nr:hypothetical protein [Sphingomonas aliaeris]QQV77616.1 hypothetical protein H5J25_02075 [Sphingomonas aliaeris]
MRAGPHRWKMLVMAAVAPSVLAGCDSRSANVSIPENVQVVIAATPTAPPRSNRAALIPPGPTTAAAIAAPPKSLSDMRPRKTFADPPLPPELTDDGGLRPLPPPPAR